ncbi:MAG TPA: 30S ribosomal protein S27ae [Candidatus Lokiarchaeia archaeon]|nr:30S ribosomal protein S27ae [Candidatus Lokiarchaeia archaeon]
MAKKAEKPAAAKKTEKPAAEKPAAAEGGEEKPAAAKGAAGKGAAKPAGKGGARAGGKGGAPAPAKKQKKKVTKKLYEVSNGKISRLRPECPRCGNGFYMAVHYNRRTCGQCSFTQFTDKDGNVRGAGTMPGAGPAGVMRHSRRVNREQPRGGAPPAGGDSE